MCRSHGNDLVPREQILDLALLVALDDGGERGGQPSMGIDAVHLAGLDQRGDDGPVFSAGIMASEERIFSVQGNGAAGALDSVVVDLVGYR